MLPPCDVEPELDDPSPLLELLESSEPELEELDPELDPELSELEPLELELLEPEPLLVLLEPESSSELVEPAVVPVLPESECFADTTATDRPVPPIPSTAVAIAAAPARRNQRRLDEWESSNASGVTMAVSLAGGSSAALQEKVKRPSSSPESSLRVILRDHWSRPLTAGGQSVWQCLPIVSTMSSDTSPSTASRSGPKTSTKN